MTFPLTRSILVFQTSHKREKNETIEYIYRFEFESHNSF